VKVSSGMTASADLRFAIQGRWKARLPELLATLSSLGRARKLDDGHWWDDGK
jgi:hypothetical protein